MLLYTCSLACGFVGLFACLVVCGVVVCSEVGVYFVCGWLVVCCLWSLARFGVGWSLLACCCFAGE